jgi:hypothetical protein
MGSVWKVESTSQFERKIKAHQILVLQWRIFLLQCKTDIHVTHVKTCSLHKQMIAVLKDVTESKAASVTWNIMHSNALLTPVQTNNPQLYQPQSLCHLRALIPAMWAPLIAPCHNFTTLPLPQLFPQSRRFGVGSDMAVDFSMNTLFTQLIWSFHALN